jgi:hypothetical protein
MDDANGARQNDALRHAECISFDDTKPFLDQMKGRMACRGDSWPEEGPDGEYIGVGHNGTSLPAALSMIWAPH